MTKNKKDKNQKTDLENIRKLLDEIDDNLQAVRKFLFSSAYQKDLIVLKKDKDGRIIEGIFNGENMLDKDQKVYIIPPNYASKSKLVPGDILKLTISSDGSYIYKQIGPVERKTIIGILEKNNNRYHVKSDDKKYQVLSASVTYFKANEGDKLTIIIPKNKESDWAAVENLIEK